MRSVTGAGPTEFANRNLVICAVCRRMCWMMWCRRRRLVVGCAVKVTPLCFEASMLPKLRALLSAVALLTLSGCRGDSPPDDTPSAVLQSEVAQVVGATSCVLDIDAPAAARCVGVFPDTLFGDGRSGQFLLDSLFGNNSAKEGRQSTFAFASNIGRRRPALTGPGVFLNLRASADARRHPGLSTIAEGTAYVTLRVRTEDNKAPDRKYRLSTRGTDGSTNNALRQYFLFVARPLGDIGAIDSTVPFPVAAMEVYGFTPGNEATLRRIQPGASVYFRQCPHSRYHPDDPQVRAAFLPCVLAHNVQAAADESGYGFDAFLTALEQKSDSNPFLPRTMSTLTSDLLDAPEAGIWFTCEKGCCTADYLF